jgi:hypothetical protein
LTGAGEPGSFTSASHAFGCDGPADAWPFLNAITPRGRANGIAAREGSPIKTATEAMSGSSGMFNDL